MPKDRRLYMTFPIDFHRHPKLRKLAPDVRWTFVEMNGEARIAENDGVFTVEEAEFEWPREHLEALAASHPSRPLVIRDGSTYVIRDYAEHQFTTADKERLAEISRKNGAKGGRPRKPRETHAGSEKTQPFAESESESESETPDSSKTYRDQSGNNRARELTDPGFSSRTTKWLAENAGIDDPAAFARTINNELGLTVAWDHLPAIVNHYTSRAKGNVPKPVGYAIASIRDDREAARKFIYESGYAD